MEICVKHLVEINNNSCSVPKQKDGNVCATPGGDSGERGQRHFVANDLNLVATAGLGHRVTIKMATTMAVYGPREKE